MSRLLPWLGAVVVLGCLTTPVAVAGVGSSAVVPKIDEFSGMMADLAEDGAMVDGLAAAAAPRTGAIAAPATGGGGTGIRDFDRAEVLAALDRVLAARMAILDHAERMIERAAAMPATGTLESVRKAIDAALRANEAALEGVLAAVDDLEIPLATRRAVRQVLARVETRPAELSRLMTDLVPASDSETCADEGLD